MDIEFKNKYLKYKIKYYDLKNSIGGNDSIEYQLESDRRFKNKNFLRKTIIKLTLKTLKESRTEYVKQYKKNEINKTEYKLKLAEIDLKIAKIKLIQERILNSNSASNCEKTIRIEYDKSDVDKSKIKLSEFSNEQIKIIDCVTLKGYINLEKKDFDYVNSIIDNHEKLTKLNHKFVQKDANPFVSEYEDNILFGLFSSHDIGSYNTDLGIASQYELLREVIKNIEEATIVKFESNVERDEFKKRIKDYKLKIAPILVERNLEVENKKKEDLELKEKEKDQKEKQENEKKVELENIKEHIKVFEEKRKEEFIKLLKELNLKSGEEFFAFIDKNHKILLDYQKDIPRSKYDKGNLDCDFDDLLFKKEKEIRVAKEFEEKAKNTMMVSSGMTTLEKYVAKNAKKEGTTSVEEAKKIYEELKQKKIFCKATNLLNSIKKIMNNNVNNFFDDIIKVINPYYNEVIKSKIINWELDKLSSNPKVIELLNSLEDYQPNGRKIRNMVSEKYPNKDNLERACMFPIYETDWPACLNHNRYSSKEIEDLVRNAKFKFDSKAVVVQE